MTENISRKNRYDRRDSYKIRLIISAVLFVCFIIEFLMMKSGIMEDIDESAGAFARSLRTEALNPVMIFITNLGRWTTIVGIGVCIMIADLIWMKKPDYPIAIGGCLVNLGIYSILKRVIQRPRPSEEFWLITEHGFSFPSGHTMNGVFCYSMMLYLILISTENETLKKDSCVFFPVIVFLIGISRIYCGVHYLSDVLGGALIGLSLFLLATVVIDDGLRRVSRTI